MALLGRLLPALIVAASAVSARAGSEERLHLLYAEPLPSISIERAASSRPAGVRAPVVRMRFHALQRDFDATLESNDRVLQGLDSASRARLGSLELYRGTLAGIPGSWVRLNIHDDVVRALIWDGVELYAIEPAENLRNLPGAPPLGARLAIVRVADVLRDYRDRVVAGTSAAPAISYEQLQHELAGLNAAPRRRVDVGIVTDFEATSLFANQGGAPLAVAERVNYVDGIFAEQVGVQVHLTEIESFAVEPDPFSTRDPDMLLQQLSDHRLQTPALASLGLVHLLTSKDLTGLIIGEAYQTSLCTAAEAVGLTHVSYEPFVDALVTAHEMGHNFGAPHDAENGSPCESTPDTFLMAPVFNSSSEFSQCSLGQMAPVIAAASCLAPVLPSDLAVAVDAVTTVDANTMNTIGLQLSNIGSGNAYDVTFDISMDPGLSIDQMMIPLPLYCDELEPQSARCAADLLGAGMSATVQLTTLSGDPTVVNLRVTAAASNDASQANNSVTQQIRIVAAPVFALEFAPSRLVLHPDESGTIQVIVRNDGTRASDAVLTINAGFHTQIHVESVLPESATCSVLGFPYTCTVASLEPGHETSIAVTVHAPPAVDAATELQDELRVEVSSTQFPNVGLIQSAAVGSYTALAELQVRLVSGPDQLHQGESGRIVVAIDNSGPDAVENVILSIGDSIGGMNTDLHTDSGTCTFDSTFGNCQIPRIEAGHSVEAELDVQLGASEQYGIDRQFLLDHRGVSDSEPHDDAVYVSVEGLPAPSGGTGNGSSSGGGGGGGGASLSLLLLALYAKRARRPSGPINAAADISYI